MDAQIWGPMFWDLLFDVAHFYKDIEDSGDQADVAKFFNLTQYVLPCETCREHYREYLGTCGTDLTKCRDIGKEFLYPVKRQINFRLLKPNISLKTYTTRRHYFTLNGNGFSVNKLVHLLETKLVKRDVSLNTGKIKEWCAVTERITQPMYGYGESAAVKCIVRSPESTEESSETMSADTGKISSRRVG